MKFIYALVVALTSCATPPRDEGAGTPGGDAGTTSETDGNAADPWADAAADVGGIPSPEPEPTPTPAPETTEPAPTPTPTATPEPSAQPVEGADDFEPEQRPEDNASDDGPVEVDEGDLTSKSQTPRTARRSPSRAVKAGGGIGAELVLGGEYAMMSGFVTSNMLRTNAMIISPAWDIGAGVLVAGTVSASTGSAEDGAAKFRATDFGLGARWFYGSYPVFLGTEYLAQYRRVYANNDQRSDDLVGGYQSGGKFEIGAQWSIASLAPGLSFEAGLANTLGREMSFRRLKFNGKYQDINPSFWALRLGLGYAF